MTRGFSAVGLFNPKTPANVGSALRACECYGASLMVVSGNRYNRHPTDVFNTFKKIPLLHCTDLKDAIPFDCVPVAVELIRTSKSLVGYRHPERAFYIFGPEDGTLGDKVLSWCRDVVYIPTNNCMNLAATVNVVLYDRAAKGNPA